MRKKERGKYKEREVKRGGVGEKGRQKEKERVRKRGRERRRYTLRK